METVRSNLAHLLERIPPAWRHALAAFLAVRVMATAVAALALTTVPANPIVAAGGYAKPAYSPVVEMLLGAWERSDALWYLHLAQQGYGHPQSAAFMPLYPWLIRAVSAVGLPPLAAALLVSNAAFLLALYFVYRLGEIEIGPEAAERAVWYQALFPGALFCLAPYTESLYLCLATGAFLAARTGRWARSGVAGALLAATRTVGVAVALPLAVEAVQSRARPVPSAPSARWGPLWLLLVPLGLGAVMLVGRAVLGNPWAFVRSQGGWSRQWEWPWVSLLGGFRQAGEFLLADTGGIFLLEAGCTVFALALAGLAFLRLRPAYALFAWIGLVVPLCIPFPGNYLMSMPRFVAVLFPCFLVLAGLVRSPAADSFVRAVMAGLYGLCVALYVGSRSMF